LLTGATGFIGRHLAAALTAAGHEVVCAVRRPAVNAPKSTQSGRREVAADFTRDFDAADWMPRLLGVEAVINAVGIIREQGAQTFDAIHTRAACALFAACAAAGVRLVLQVSALGADESATSRDHLSKKRADDFLAAQPVHSVIIQPSVVFGRDGSSARFFTLLASLPVIGLPGGGRQQLQPVHIDDLVAAVLAQLERPEQRLPSGTRLPVVGPQALSLRDYLAQLRAALGMRGGFFVPVPMFLVRIGARLGTLLPGSLLDPETLSMLERGNTGDPAMLTRALGHAPRGVGAFIEPEARAAMKTRAQLGWLLPVLRISIALVWIVTGIVSLGLYPVQESYALLARVGIGGWLAPVMLYGAALLDLGFGIATLMPRSHGGRYWLWLMQAAVILFYTAVISWRLPEFWLHPYGPLLKNLPMLAAIWLLFELEER
jgi:uncharacterized protein YbjT (DUF2867 family)